MNATRTAEDVRFSRRWGWIGIVVVCPLSIPLHFLYEWSGELTLVGMFTPINESIWEHLNLVYWPLLIWWGAGYFLYKDKKSLSFEKWLPAAAVSILFSMIFISSWYYVWTVAFATESSIIDIGSLFIAVPLGQLIAIHVYRVIKPRAVYWGSAIILLIFIGALFIYFTFAPPNLPFFIPPN